MNACQHWLMFDQGLVKCTHPNSDRCRCKFDIAWLVDIKCPLNRLNWKDEETS